MAPRLPLLGDEADSHVGARRDERVARKAEKAHEQLSGRSPFEPLPFRHCLGLQPSQLEGDARVHR